MHGDEEGRLSFKFLVKISSLGRRMENFYQNTQYIYFEGIWIYVEVKA